ncbi:MAG: DNA repair protein RecO [Clostridiales bacterium]|nr:DNA repair protein RecO [Clostridiales bacterium]
MVQYKTEAIVLRLRKYREADALVTLFTRERGRISAVARGIYKPVSKLRGGVQPFSVNEMMLDAGRSTLHTLIQSECTEILLPMRQSYEAMTLGSYWAELLENFGQEEMADEALYQLAKAGFLGLALDPGLLMCRTLEIRLIGQQGLRPDFALCCRCGGPIGKDKVSWFTPSEGGFLCGSCAKAGRGASSLSPAVPGLWEGLESIALDKLKRVRVTGVQLDELGNALRLWILWHTGRPMKTWPMMNTIREVRK